MKSRLLNDLNRVNLNCESNRPEVAARAIYYAAHHNRREMCVGMPTLAGIGFAGAVYGVFARNGR